MTSILAPIYSARDTAVTQRPTSTSLLCIDSEDRFADNFALRDPAARAASTPYNFTITKNQSLMNGFFTRLGVTEVVFPWTIPNINEATKIVGFDYKIGAAPTVSSSVLLDLGFYTPAMIASAIQADVRGQDAGLAAFTMTYGVDDAGAQGPVFLYNTNAVGVTVRFYPLDSADMSTIPQINLGSRQLFDLLGFTTVQQTLSVNGQGYTTYCQPTRYVDIVCTQLTANQALKDTMSQKVARDVMCRVYLGDAQGVQSTVLPSSATFCPPGCMPTTIYRNFSQPKQIQWIPNQPVPGYLKFEVFDDAGNPLDWLSLDDASDGANWSMTIAVTEN
jgi:hypothetical protein